MINLDYQSRKPIYEQIVQQIEKYVALGVLKPAEQIPPIRDMATMLGINPNTVKKAYSILEQKGVIITLSTKGTYITEQTGKVLEATIDKKISDAKTDLENQINDLSPSPIYKSASAPEENTSLSSKDLEKIHQLFWLNTSKGNGVLNYW